MSNIFGNLKAKVANAEQATDRVGGGFAKLDTDIYVGILKVAYAGKSDKGANFLQIIVEQVRNLNTGATVSDYRETAYFTNKEGSPTYEKNGKEFFLPGYTVASDLLFMTTGTDLTDAVFEEKVVNVYNFDEKKELPKSVMVAIEAVGQPVMFAIKKTIEPKQTKGADGKYVNTGETREENSIEKVFHPEFKLTMLEIEAIMKAERDPTPEDVVFLPAWVEANQGKVFDNSKKGQAAGGKPGTPPSAGGSAAGGEAKKSLFGKK